ncbi:AAA family ATPase [Sunxiuqinia elliptica]
MKSNAKEYLIEFASSQEDWLKALIYSAIETNGSISSDRKKEIFKCLQDSTAIEYTIPNIVDSDSDAEIVLTKLVHKEGVNALTENQIIKFHDDVTIINGLNGAGKSGYFKIINEIVGGNQVKEILPNIYKDNPPEIDVEISYKESRNQTTVNWNGNSRSLEKLNKCKVFDTSYLNGLLETRQNDTTLIQPLGLNIFTYLIDLLDKFKNQLSINADKKRILKPNIDLINISDEIQSVFQNHNLTETRKKEIIKLFDFSDENGKKLDDLNKEIKTLKQVNIQDRIKILTDSRNSILNLKEWLTNNHRVLSECITESKKLIDVKKEKQVANNQAKEQFDVLNSIPSSNTKEWKEFIIAGQAYSKTLENNVGVCPYCMQELQSDNSVKILQAYGSFLQDNSERELKQAVTILHSKLKKIEGLSLEYQLIENTNSILKEKHKNEKSLYDLVVLTINNYKSVKANLVELIKKEDSNFKVSTLDIIPLATELNTISEELKTQIDNYSKEDSEKKEKIRLIEQKLKNLKENQAISLQKDNIVKWMGLTVEESILKKKATKINTRQLSSLSKTANDDLLTEALKVKFNEELAFIGYPNLDVKIENAGTRKGVSSTKLVLTRSNAIKSILSEGEQKAVALALFIAEVRMQKQKNPIVLDDPVNSLDHKIAGKFAERLLNLNNQIVIFNHNRLFLDSFETSKNNHICKTTDTDCNKNQGKHIKVYEVIAQSKHMKGVLRNYKGNYAKNHIKDAKRLLNQIPFEDDTKVANLLRLSVECTIDEVIFNHQVPTRFSNKNSRIAWAELKNIKNDSEIVDSLERIHGRVSGGQMHNGTERNENPIDIDEFNRMITDIESILN